MTLPVRWLRLLAGLAAAASLTVSAYAALDEPTPVPEGARVSLTFSNGPNFVLGDVIELTFTLANEGPAQFQYTTGGDQRGTGFPTRYKFTVEDEMGKPLTPEALLDMGGISGSRELKSGEQHYKLLRLQNYVRVDRPGVFTVRVVHDFGWKATPAQPLPVASAKIVVALPTADQAENRVKAVASSREPLTANGLGAYWHKTDYRYLSHPVFLPALERRAAAGHLTAFEGLQRIRSTNATLVLVRLLAVREPDIIHAAALFLTRRMPPRIVGGHPRVPFGSFGQAETTATNLWLPEAAEPLRLAAGKLLASTNLSHVRTGAFVVEALGTDADGALVLEALTPTLNEWHLRERPDDNILNAPGAGDALIAALAGLRERGYRAPRNGGLNTILARFLELGDASIPRGEGWEPTLGAFFSQNPPMLREAAVHALPKPPTGKWEKLLLRALDDRDRGVMRAACTVAGESKNPVFTKPLANIVRTERHEWVVREASNALVGIGSRWAATAAWIERLTDEKLYNDALRFLVETLQHPKSHGSGGRTDMPRDARVAMRKKWQKFFADEARRAQVQSGQPVSVTEDVARDLFSGVIHLTTEDGRPWPSERP